MTGASTTTLAARAALAGATLLLFPLLGFP